MHVRVKTLLTSYIAIYINLMIQVKHYVDTKKAGKGVAEARMKFIDFYKELPNAEVFEHVDITCFKERPANEAEEEQTAKKEKKEVCLVLTILYPYLLAMLHPTSLLLHIH